MERGASWQQNFSEWKLKSKGSKRNCWRLDVTRQYRLPKERTRLFYQISYTYRMRSRSEYVRPENLAALRAEITNFRRFRKLVDRWVGLALAASQLRVRGSLEKT
jgi:hypothetical protein